VNETIATIRSLRTVHGNFAERSIPKDQLELILNSCTRAANASARQSYAIIVREGMAPVRDLVGYAAPVVLVFCVDFASHIRLARHLGHEFPRANVIEFVTGAFDTALAAQTAAIAAKSLGIDSMFTNAIHRCDINTVYQKLRLPEDGCFPLMALVLGYAAAEPGYQMGRPAAAVHRDTYQANPTAQELDVMVTAYDAPHMGLNDNWASEGFAHYLDWFYTRWCRRPADAKLEQFRSILARAGFR
jgi:nitroreductase